MKSKYFAGAVACPVCGTIREGSNRERCQNCLAQGHMYRMFSLADLDASIEYNLRHGFDVYATRLVSIRAKLASAILDQQDGGGQ